MEINRKICVAIGENDITKALEIAQQVKGADVVEIRLDYFKTPDVAPFVNSIKIPLLFTCRPTWEGGLFKGAEDDRVIILSSAVAAGADYVDIELEASELVHSQLSSVIKKYGSKTKKILSNHDFSKTLPYEVLKEKVLQMKVKGADVGKLITTAETTADVLKIFKLHEYAKEISFPLIAFCMGTVGAVSRVACCDFGSYMTYCSADGQDVTAPGQINVSGLNTIYSLYP